MGQTSLKLFDKGDATYYV